MSRNVCHYGRAASPDASASRQARAAAKPGKNSDGPAVASQSSRGGGQLVAQRSPLDPEP